MNRTLTLNRSLVTFGIPLGSIGVLILVMNSPLLASEPTMSLAITIDLLLTIPLIYFLLIRNTTVPKTTVVPMMILGTVVAIIFLPQDEQVYLSLFKYWVLPLIELSVVTFVVLKVRKAAKQYKIVKGTTPDFFNALREACSDILPQRLVWPFATELAVFYYGFINWSSRRVEPNEFTYHRNSGTPALFGAVIFIVLIETIALHLLVGHWYTVAAWILSGFSIYTALQIIGFAKSLSQRPIVINKRTLTLKYGILAEAEIQLKEIEEVTVSGQALEENALTKTLSPLGELESHNVIIRLKHEHALTGLYGFKKKFKTLGLHVDEPAHFKSSLALACCEVD